MKQLLQNPEFKIRRKWWILIGVTTVWLLAMTLRPDHTLNHVNLVPLAEHSVALGCVINSQCAQQGQALRFLIIDVLGNIVVFVPLGVGLAGALHQGNRRQTIWRAMLGGLLLSIAIELMQTAIPSRATDIDDLIFNTLGTALGALLFLYLFQWPKSTRWQKQELSG